MNERQPSIINQIGVCENHSCSQASTRCPAASELESSLQLNDPPGQTARRGPGTGEKYRLFAAGPGVTPNVGAILPGLHPFDRANPDDVAWQQEQTDVLLSWGDKSCRAGLS